MISDAFYFFLLTLCLPVTLDWLFLTARWFHKYKWPRVQNAAVLWVIHNQNINTEQIIYK